MKTCLFTGPHPPIQESSKPCPVEPKRIVAVYPLSKRYTGRDISMNNINARINNVVFAPGPYGLPGASVFFKGRKNSFITLPNRGPLDTKDSITMLAWINTFGNSGPIVNFHPNGWGVHWWVISGNRLFVRFVMRKSRRSTPPLIYRNLRPGKWMYVGTSYNKKTGKAALYVNSRKVASKYIGKFQLATNYSVRMGARIGDRRFFKGRVACLQVFNYELSIAKIKKRKHFCFKRGKKALVTCDLR